MSESAESGRGSKVMRSRLGCLTCRKSRKKCDERRPSCSRCHRTLSQCVWPALKPTSDVLINAHELASILSLSTADVQANNAPNSASGTASSSTQSTSHLYLDESLMMPNSDIWESTGLMNSLGSRSLNSLSLGPSFSSWATGGTLNKSGTTQESGDAWGPMTSRWEYAQDFGPRISWPPEGFASCDELDTEGAMPTFHQSVTALTRQISPEPLFQDVCYFYSTFLTRVFYDYALVPDSLPKWAYQRFNTSNTSKYAMLATTALFRADFERSIMVPSLRACAKGFYSAALRHLSHDLEDNRLSPQEKLTGLVELMNYEYHSGQFADYYSHGAMGAPLVKAIIGCDTLNFLNIRGIRNFDVLYFAWCDILDSMAASRPTWFKHEPDLDHAAQLGTEENAASEDKGIEWIYGCPNIIALLLARTSALRDAEISKEEKRTRGAEIEQLIRNWQLQPKGARDAVLRVTRMGAQEVWRHAGILYVHHAVLKSDPSHPSVRDSVKAIIKIASTFKRGCNPDSFVAPPYFLAGFYATTQKERYILKSRLLSTGNGKFLQNLANNLDELWKETDSSGRLTSWSEKKPPRVAF